jgi:DNA polymerase-1
VEEDVISPLSTDAGRAWLATQYERYGIADPPRTQKGQKLAIGSDDLKLLMEDPRCTPDLRAMFALMCIVTGIRTVYQNAMSNLAPDGRVHARISMRQSSGRWSTTDPGLTVFGKHEGRHAERDVFTADPGHVLFSADLAQVDMRGIAGLCQDPAYMALFAPGRDVHSEIAAQLGLTRQESKPAGHGWNYGRGRDAMIKGGLDPVKVDMFINGMESQFPVLCAWREQIRTAGAAGAILDNGFGRRMRCDPNRAYTVAPALMGQGSAGDIMKEVLRRLDARAPELRPYYRVMVHDEQVFSVPGKDAADIIETVREAFTWEFRGVPITCDINGPGRTWGEISAK